MEESRLLGLLQRHDPDMRFEVQLRKPIPASRVPADRRRYVTFVFAVKVGDQEVMVIEERYASSPYSASPGARFTGRLLLARRAEPLALTRSRERRAFVKEQCCGWRHTAG